MTPLSQRSAETLALEALTWLVGNDELLPVFLGSTGVSEADVRQRANDPQFLGSVLDFILMDDSWVIAFCTQSDRDLSYPMRARAVLPGGAQVNWT